MSSGWPAGVCLAVQSWRNWYLSHMARPHSMLSCCLLHALSACLQYKVVGAIGTQAKCFYSVLSGWAAGMSLAVWYLSHMAPFQAFSMPSRFPVRVSLAVQSCWRNWYLSYMALFCAFWVVCQRAFASTTLLAQLLLEPHGPSTCFLDAFWVPCRHVSDSTMLLAQLVLEPHGSILWFLGGLLACLWQYAVGGAIAT